MISNFTTSYLLSKRGNWTLYLYKQNSLDRTIFIQVLTILRTPWQLDSPDESITLVFKDSDLLDGAEGGEGLLYQVLAKPIGQTSTVDRAVGRTGLVVHLVKRQRLRVHWKQKLQSAVGGKFDRVTNRRGSWKKFPPLIQV